MELQQPVTRIFRETVKAQTPIVINVGGTGSSKSYSIAQLICAKFLCENGKNFLITRKTLPSLRITSYKLIIDMLKAWNVYGSVLHNKSVREIRRGTNWMLFTSIDDEKKIRSTEFNYIWAEEANEFSKDELIQLTLRFGAKKPETDLNQIFLSYNPSDANDAVAAFEKRPDATVIRSTYRDNPFLERQKVQEVEALKEIDETFWRIYGLGEYAVSTNLIYTNWRIVESFPAAAEAQEPFYGLDFGYNNETALIECKLYDGELYERELIYETKLTNADLIERLKGCVSVLAPIYADEAEPQRIEEIRQAGFYRIEAVRKGKESVRNGIDVIKRLKVNVDANSTNLIAEKKAYKWRTDRQGNFLDEPVPFKNHLMDAERYAVIGHLQPKRKFEVLFQE
jgi:phage terminase large subunit